MILNVYQTVISCKEKKICSICCPFFIWILPHGWMLLVCNIHPIALKKKEKKSVYMLIFLILDYLVTWDKWPKMFILKEKEND